jgi:hypothetical protein
MDRPNFRNSIKSKLLVVFILLYFNNLQSQSINVITWSDHAIIDENHLYPPLTAGADYAQNIALPTQALLAIEELEPETPWCLSIQHTHSIGGAALYARVRYDLLRPENWDPGSPVEAPISLSAEPLISGIGSIRELVVEFELRGASVATDYDLRAENLLWTLTGGGCPAAP